jgi:hypothetical protein
MYCASLDKDRITQQTVVLYMYNVRCTMYMHCWNKENIMAVNGKKEYKLAKYLESENEVILFRRLFENQS